MTVKIFDRPDVQEFLNVLSGLDKADGNPRMKEIIHPAGVGPVQGDR